MNRYDLHVFGITAPLLLHGTLSRLSDQHTPIVFLFDENHGSDECIEQNIENAKELVTKANVTLIGVESHQGGKEWDEYEGRYHPNRFNDGTNIHAVNNCSKFADQLRNCEADVVGVECVGMLNQQHCDFVVGGEWHGKPAREHPMNKARSKHFVRTLLDLWRRNGSVGNMILNAGGDHISHIVSWINDGSVENITEQKAVYINVQAPAFATV